jgi:hypothetical protein
MKLFRGVFMNYDDLYKLYDLFNKTRSSSENMDWFDDYVEDVFGKGVILRQPGSSVSLPSSTVMPTDRGFVTESEVDEMFSVSVDSMQELLNFTRSMMDMNSTTKRLSYNVHMRWTTCIICEKDDDDVKVYYVNPNAE